MSFDLNDRIAKLLIDEPFFAALSRNLPKRQDDSIPTACISVDLETGRYEMLYNNAFFSGLTETQQRGVLKHEFYHVVFEHVTRRRPADTSPDAQKLWNHATDLAINSHLKGELPEGVLMPGEGVYKDLPLGESADWYLAHMPKAGSNNESGGGDGGGDGGDEQQGQQNKGDENKDDQGKSNGSGDEGEEDNKDSQGNGSGDGGGHDGWGGEGNSEAEQMARQRLKEDVKKAAQEAATKGWGTVSSSAKKDILDRLEAKVDWRKVLRYFIKTSQRSHRSSSIKRINKRYAYIHPGKRVKRNAKVAIAIDQSGSVSDQMLAAFFSELNKLATLATFIVVPFDTQVEESKVYEWKKGQNKKAERVLCGGTCFEAPTKWANENNVDGLIILTDMEAAKPSRCKAQRLWMTTKACAQRPYFQTNERVIPIDV